jgi:hypothetical protein
MAEKEAQLLEKTLKLSITQPNTQIITDTAAHVCNQGYCIVALDDSEIAAIEYDSDSNSNTLVGVTIPTGLHLYLNDIKSLTLTSGAVAVYQQGKG